MLCSTSSIFRWFDLWSYSLQTACLSHHLKLKTSLDSSPAVPFSSPSVLLYTERAFVWDHFDITGLTLMWPQLSAEVFIALLSGLCCAKCDEVIITFAVGSVYEFTYLLSVWTIMFYISYQGCAIWSNYLNHYKDFILSPSSNLLFH